MIKKHKRTLVLSWLTKILSSENFIDWGDRGWGATHATVVKLPTALTAGHLCRPGLLLTAMPGLHVKQQWKWRPWVQGLALDLSSAIGRRSRQPQCYSH